jgi:phosphatidylglycerophosphate synthase
METLIDDQQQIDTMFLRLVSPLIKDRREEFVAGMNNWQILARATNDYVTPANAFDAVGFAASMYGIYNLDSWKGIAAAAGGFMTDVFDGKIARGTGTATDKGEIVDATGDKIKLAFALAQIWRLDLAPKWLIGAVLVQNSANVVMTAADRRLNKKEPVLHASIFGKRAMFLEQWGLGLHVIGSEVQKKNERRGRYIKAAGTIVGLAGLGLGGAASFGYARTLLASRKDHSKQKRT